jgi:hypothetical protein
MSCNNIPNNIINITEANNYIKTHDDVNYNDWLECLNISILNNLQDSTDTKEININNDTANESNTYSLYLYNNDVTYTYSKIIFFIVLLITYGYFFKLSNIPNLLVSLYENIKNKIFVPTVTKN